MRRSRRVVLGLLSVAVAAALFVWTGTLVAQSGLAQLGLTEATARTFVLDEIKSPATGRGSGIVVAGTRAFLKLPASARGPAASVLFVWAKAYVSSPAFKTSYNTYRQGRLPTARQYALTVEEEVKRDLAEQLAGMEQLAQAAASMPPADKANIMASVEKARVMYTDPAFIKQQQEMVAAERAQESWRIHANSRRSRGHDASRPAGALCQAAARVPQRDSRRELLGSHAQLDGWTRRHRVSRQSR